MDWRELAAIAKDEIQEILARNRGRVAGRTRYEIDTIRDGWEEDATAHVIHRVTFSQQPTCGFQIAVGDFEPCVDKADEEAFRAVVRHRVLRVLDETPMPPIAKGGQEPDRERKEFMKKTEGERRAILTDMLAKQLARSPMAANDQDSVSHSMGRVAEVAAARELPADRIARENDEKMWSAPPVSTAIPSSNWTPAEADEYRQRLVSMGWLPPGSSPAPELIDHLHMHDRAIATLKLQIAECCKAVDRMTADKRPGGKVPEISATFVAPGVMKTADEIRDYLEKFGLSASEYGRILNLDTLEADVIISDMASAVIAVRMIVFARCMTRWPLSGPVGWTAKVVKLVETETDFQYVHGWIDVFDTLNRGFCIDSAQVVGQSIATVKMIVDVQLKPMFEAFDQIDSARHPAAPTSPAAGSPSGRSDLPEPPPQQWEIKDSADAIDAVRIWVADHLSYPFSCEVRWSSNLPLKQPDGVQDIIVVSLSRPHVGGSQFAVDKHELIEQPPSHGRKLVIERLNEAIQDINRQQSAETGQYLQADY